MLSWGEVLMWQQGPLSTAETSLTAAQRALGACADELATMGVPRRWVGPASEHARSECTELNDEIEGLVAEVAAVRRAVIEAGDAIPEVKRLVEAALDYANDNQLSIDSDGTVTDHYVVPESTGLPSDEPTRGGLVLRGVGLVESALKRADEVDAALAAVLAGVLDGTIDDVSADSVGDAARQGDIVGGRSPLEPPSEGTPAEVASWWAGLSARDRAFLLESHPDWLGNRDGVPFDVRDQANRAQMAALRRELEAEQERLAGLAETYSYSNSPTNYDHAVDEVNAKLEALAMLEKLAAQGDHAILGMDFSQERAQAIVAQGDFDDADYLGVFTPGLTSTVGGIGGNDAAMASLRELAATKVVDDMSPAEIREAGGVAAAREAAMDRVAVATWLDYQAPQFGSTFTLDNSVADSGTAEKGGGDLADFYRGIDASRSDDPDVTALGHSYGSTTTGYALQHDGLGVDRAGLFGSPGLGTSDAGDFSIPADQIWYGEAKGDPVGDFGSFGTDPSTLDGIRHFETGPSTGSDGTPLGGSTGHTSYLDDGTTTQDGLAGLLVGQSEKVTVGDNIGIGDPPDHWRFPW